MLYYTILYYVLHTLLLLSKVHTLLLPLLHRIGLRYSAYIAYIFKLKSRCVISKISLDPVRDTYAKHQNTNVVTAKQAVSKQAAMDVQMSSEALVKHCNVYRKSAWTKCYVAKSLIQIKTLIDAIITEIVIFAYFCSPVGDLDQISSN